jgi:hypothetical protein
MVRYVEINAAAYFWGYTDEWPDAETAASLQRAKEILAIGAVQTGLNPPEHVSAMTSVCFGLPAGRLSREVLS